MILRRVDPLPAAAAGVGPFRIQVVPSERGAFSSMPTDQAPGLFGASLDDDAGSLALRAHEYGHLALGRMGLVPESRPRGIADVWWQATLDVCVNTFMVMRGSDAVRKLTLIGAEMPSERWMLAALWLRAEHLDCGRQIRDEAFAAGLSSEDVGVLALSTSQLTDWACRAARDERPDFKLILKIARMLQKRFGPVGRNMAQSAVLPFFGTPVLQEGEWGAMDIVDLTDRQQPVHRQGPAPVPGFVGALRFVHRALPGSDGRVFGQRKRMGGVKGTILIDCSGSMNLSMAEVLDLVEAVPAGTIAAYAGHVEHSMSGVLAILATKGRLAARGTDLSRVLGKGNVVDGPALKWLAGQPEPRIWVSDGVVTGVGDVQASSLYQEVLRLLKSGRIRQVATVSESIERLRRC